MAQAGSAQREPSMEEILASIRRIIEDSDGTQEPATHAGVQPEENIDEGLDETGDVEHFRAELNEAPQDPENIVSELRPANTPESGEAEADHEIYAPAAQVPAAEASRSSVLDWPVNDWNSGERGEEPDRFDASVGEGMAANEPSARDEAEQDREETAERRPAIISELAERKIAAAFEELNDAFETSRRQSLDEMAEEMLRPMLQDWLDNNLPMLVERLVREEIERVARGK